MKYPNRFNYKPNFKSCLETQNNFLNAFVMSSASQHRINDTGKRPGCTFRFVASFEIFSTKTDFESGNNGGVLEFVENIQNEAVNRKDQPYLFCVITFRSCVTAL